jgi:hypothetical protein
VESDYIKETRLFSYVAHPPLERVNAFCEPLREKLYRFDENSLMLHLHNKRILTPSNYPRTKKKLKEIVVSKTKENMQELVDKYDEHIGKRKITVRGYFIEDLIEH